jgi:hypothetical protein
LGVDCLNNPSDAEDPTFLRAVDTSLFQIKAVQSQTRGKHFSNGQRDCCNDRFVPESDDGLEPARACITCFARSQN